MFVIADTTVLITCALVLVLWAVLIGVAVVSMRSTLATNAYMVGQFKTDSGTSLRDAIERLERSAERAEESAAVIARDLVVAKGLVEGVATDLTDSQGRANDVVEGQPGEAADAGAQGPKP